MSFTNLPNANTNFLSFATTNNPHSVPDMNTYVHVPRSSSLEQNNRILGRQRLYQGPGQGSELPAKRPKREDRRHQDYGLDQDQDQVDDMMDDDAGYEADYETDN